MDYGNILSGLAALGTLALGVYTQVLRRTHRKSIEDNSSRIADAETGLRLQLYTSEKRNDELQEELAESRSRAKKLQREVSSLRRKVRELSDRQGT